MTIQLIDPKHIQPNPWQTREREDPEHVGALADSIREHGLLQPPIHQTEFNCWHCGAFASNTRLTKRDVEEGWSAVQKGGTTLDVRCPHCARRKA